MTLLSFDLIKRPFFIIHIKPQRPLLLISYLQSTDPSFDRQDRSL